MKAPRRRSRTLAGVETGSATTPSPGSAGQLAPGLRYALQDISFVLRRWARRVGRVLTPLRITAAVCAAAALALAISQFMDFSGVAIGTTDYAVYPGLESVAPPPQVEVQSAGTLHALVMVAVAITALAVCGLALAGRARAGLVVAALGLIALVVALAIDLPNGLDEGTATLSYEGTSAELLSGFWIELVAAGVLVLGGALIALHDRGERRA